MAVAPGDMFDRYRIEELLGEGGMGRVFRAYDTKLHRDVALKVLRLDAATTSASVTTDAKAKLLREARLAASFEHENAVSVYDVGERADAEGGTVYIAMEFIAGKTLRLLITDGAASWETRTRWLFDAAKALAAAHRHGLIHRDVKPENIMVRSDGIVKVLDFGIAKRVAPVSIAPAPLHGSDPAAAFNTVQTQGNLVVGTPSYMAPEQIQGKPLDGRVDQFAWGVVAYELLTGAVPWGDKEGVKLLLAVIEMAPRPLADRAPHLPATLSQAVMRTLAKDPDDRFATMTDVLVALEPFGSLTGVRVAPASNAGGGESSMTTTGMAAFRATPRPVVEPRPRYKLVAAVAALIVLVAVATGVVRGERHAPPPVARAPLPSATVVTALPPPKTTVPDALAAYTAGLQSFRDAAFDAARQGFERAVHLDPSMGEAHFRLAILDSIVSTDEVEARRAYRNALQARTTMPLREQTLIDAFEPYFARDPPDIELTERRLEKAHATYTNDAEMALYLGYIRFMYGKLPEARVVLKQAVELDPKFGQAWAFYAGTQAYLGDIKGSLASIDTCLEACPSATDCLWYRTLIHEQSGDCAAFESDVRQWIARDPEDYYGYQMLSRALRANHNTEDTVVAALEQKWAHSAPDKRHRFELMDRSRLALYAGDFTRAEKLARELDALVASSPSLEPHATPTSFLLDIYEETGRRDKARDTARSFLERKQAWTEPTRADDLAIIIDPTPAALAAVKRGDGMGEDELGLARDRWIAHMRARTTDAYANFLWIFGYAATVRTANEARVAMAALPRFQPLPPFTPQSLADAHIGNVYVRAERWREALPYLEKAVATCVIQGEPIDYMHAALHLGEARAHLGDKAGACAAYGIVLEHWGNATPSSVSATAARQQRALLGCGK